VPVHTTDHECPRGGQTVDKTAASRRNIHRGRLVGFEFLLDVAGSGGRGGVGSHGGHEDEVDILDFQFGVRNGEARGFHRQVAGGLFGGGQVTFPDTGPGDDPLIAGFHHFLEIGVGQDLRGR